MTDKDYENKKRECWEEFRTHVVCGTDNPKGWFERAFDRAFALGKQFGNPEQLNAEETSLWSRLTDNEKRKMQCCYHTNECVLRDHRKRTGDKAQTRATARMKLLENLFGKDNLKVKKK